ncbi:FUSC family protein [Mycobacterium sp. CVI_P3]|uniref:FUSC family protein n=1 Tax=Mycobacterium pinniadriaticum TaxID=2994102 RepID=A0ABT3SMK7_9MYCO|nr:FUSC family protein [Mycobacterium pinniadriaticum]MCX2934335.1 FUSC family protein [Mycobacterium pinniadriaticum]MCX2940758.1 FUSC family protein [Mycobacterium pinniadriaticum]
MSPAALWRRAAERIKTRDPENDAARRAVRAAIVIPIAAAVSFTLGGGSQTPLFTIFGSIALLIIVDFPGNMNSRALAYSGLGVNGAVLISLGTLAAPIPWLAVTLMFVIGVAVTFSGVLSEIVAAGRRATLLTFVLPVCTPVGPLGERLFGWLIALMICVPAALFLLPPRHHGELRRHAASVCAALADRIDGAASATDVTAAMDALRANFLGAAYRPVALTAGSRALVRVVDDLQWLCDRVTGDTGTLLGPMRQPVVQVLRDCAQVLRITQSAQRATERAQLTATHTDLRTVAIGSYRQDIVDILAEPDDDEAVALGRTLLNRRTIGAAVGVTGRLIASAAAADARPVWARVLGRRLPESGVADRVYSETAAVTALTSGHLATGSVTARNSVRTGLGLALAVLVTFVFPVQHGFWVVLGALSVLRSSALTTGTTVVRAVTGTVIGFVLGAIVIELLGTDPIVMWVLLPLVAFGSAYVPEIGSFAAGQAAFTMMVLIVFNLIVPSGWAVGLVRVEDVVVGASVGVVVSVLLWPRGAKTVVQRAIDTAGEVGARYLRAAVLRVTRGAFEHAENQVNALSHDALTVSRTLDDAVRQYLSESGGPTDSRAPVVRASSRAIRLRAAADLIADIVPPPLGVYPRARAVLEAHAAAICSRFDGSLGGVGPAAPISDDLVPALRAEAGAGELAVSAALPLVTAAANLGELELTYPPAVAAEPLRT